MEENKSFLNWIKEHRKGLIIAGVSLSAVAALIIGIKNREQLIEVWNSLKKLVAKTPETSVTRRLPDLPARPIETPIVTPEIPVNTLSKSEVVPFDVSSHIRNLHVGWKASTEKIAVAADHGYDLKPGQTWVEGYTKGGSAA